MNRVDAERDEVRASAKNNSSKLLSIVIVTWNCKMFLRECLESLAKFRDDPSTEIIVVDNDSGDGTPELIRKCYPEVSLVESGANLGFAKGTNMGLRASSGQYLCLVNPDVRVLEGCIDKMLVYMRQHPKIGLLGPRMLCADGTSARSCMGEPTLWNLFCRALALDALFPGSKLFGGFLMFYFDRDRIAQVDILNGWFWMTRKEAVEHVGFLDQTLFMYAEDLEWSKRFRDAGWEVVYFPEAEAIHYGGAASARAPVRFSVEMQRANYQYWQKNHGRLSRMAYLVIMLLHQMLRLAGFAVLWLVRKASRDKSMFKLKSSLACLQWVLGIGRHGRVPARSGIQPENMSQ
jgi:GT2 family glycosyltransferase